MPKNIFLIDNYKMVTDYCKDLLTSDVSDFVISVGNSPLAVQAIIDAKANEKIDLIVLDLKMIPAIDKSFYNLLGFIGHIRQKQPNIKIVILAGFLDFAEIENVTTKLCPEGIIDKIDIDSTTFKNIIFDILNGTNYKSETVVATLHEYLLCKNLLDSTNIKIINLITQGILTKDIPNYIPLSLSAIKKRKLKIKKILNVEDGNNEAIVKAARGMKIII